MSTSSRKQDSKPYKQLNTCKQGEGCWQHQQQLVGLAVCRVPKQPQAKQRKYVNLNISTYLIDFEHLFAKAKKGCPNKTKKTYFTHENTTFKEKQWLKHVYSLNANFAKF